MNSIGDTLRAQRLKKGISLEQVSSDIKIGKRMLEAIESDDFEKLPGGVFRKSFVHQYARALEVDRDWVSSELGKLEAFQEHPPHQVESRSNVPVVDIPPIVPERDWTAIRASVGSFLAVIGVVVACATLYTWWQNEQTSRASSMKPETPVAAAPVSQTHAKTTPAAPSPTEPAPASAAPETQAAATPAPAPAQGTVRVDVTANQMTWVQATSDGKRVFADALQAKQTKTFEATESVQLLLGNAGGVVISLNGKEIPPAGPLGQIRLVELKADGFQIVPRKSPTPEPL